MAWSSAGRSARARTLNSSTRCWTPPSRRSPRAATGPWCIPIAAATIAGLAGYPGSREAKLVRSMSRKACSPDNAACEGFFGRLKNELFYPQDWLSTTIERVHRGLGLLHPLVQRGADQDLARLTQPHRTPQKLGNRGLTSPRFPPHPQGVKFGSARQVGAALRSATRGDDDGSNVHRAQTHGHFSGHFFGAPTGYPDHQKFILWLMIVLSAYPYGSSLYTYGLRQSPGFPWTPRISTGMKSMITGRRTGDHMNRALRSSNGTANPLLSYGIAPSMAGMQRLLSVVAALWAHAFGQIAVIQAAPTAPPR